MLELKKSKSKNPVTVKCAFASAPLALIERKSRSVRAVHREAASSN